jgi:hypothetical protein
MLIESVRGELLHGEIADAYLPNAEWSVLPSPRGIARHEALA